MTSDELIDIVYTFEQESGLTIEEIRQSGEWWPLLCSELTDSELMILDDILTPNTK